MMERKRFVGNAVLSCRTDRRLLATMTLFYHQAGRLPRTKGAMVKLVMEDFVEVVVASGKARLVEDVMEADEILQNFFGSQNWNVGGRGAKTYLESLQESARMTEALGGNEFVDARRRQREAIQEHMEQRAREMGCGSLQEMLAGQAAGSATQDREAIRALEDVQDAEEEAPVTAEYHSHKQALVDRPPVLPGMERRLAEEEVEAEEIERLRRQDDAQD